MEWFDGNLVRLLAAVAVVLVAIAIRMQATLHWMRVELAELEQNTVDSRTGLLPKSALDLRLGPELVWAEIEDKQVGVAVFDVHGGHPEESARALGRVMRADENGYVMGRSRFAVGFWNTSEAGIRVAVARLAKSMQGTGYGFVEAGYALFPGNGDDLYDLITIAEQDLRPPDLLEAKTSCLS